MRRGRKGTFLYSEGGKRGTVFYSVGERGEGNVRRIKEAGV